jgi:phosphoribosylformylglycinamidine synthase
VLDDVTTRVGAQIRAAGDAIVVLGATKGELGGSQYLSLMTGDTFGAPPRVDLAAERALVTCLVEAAARRLLASAHDVSDGGLAVALVEAAGAGEAARGFTADLDLHEPGLAPAALLFGEDQARAVVSVGQGRIEELRVLARAHGVSATPVGTVGERGGPARIAAGGRVLERPIERLREVYESAIPRRMEVAAGLQAAGD